MICNIELPFFPGFYESDLETCDTPYWAIKEELQYYQEECNTPCPGLTEDDLEFDYKSYEKDVREQWADGWKNNAPEIVLSVQNIEMVSPKYYNFSTDRVFADVELRDDWQDVMRKFMKDNRDWLYKRIREDWTSYDGFDSFMSNNFDKTYADDDDEKYDIDKSWFWHLFSGKSDRWECYVSVMLGYMMYRENENIHSDLIDYALEDIYAGSYVFLTEEGEEKVAAAKEAAKAEAVSGDRTGSWCAAAAPAERRCSGWGRCRCTRCPRTAPARSPTCAPRPGPAPWSSPTGTAASTTGPWPNSCAPGATPPTWCWWPERR